MNDIEILEEKIQENKMYGIDILFNKNHLQAIENIIARNKELEEKNKELENADLTSVYLDGVYDGEKKWKSKLKELIKEIDNDTTDEGWWYINKIQELLQEKENNNG